MDKLVEQIMDKDDKKAYELTKRIIADSKESNVYYSLFDDFLSYCKNQNSYIRTRAFLLCLAQAKWDNQGKIEQSLPTLLELLHDKKPTVVRQCLNCLSENINILSKKEITTIVKDEIQKMNLNQYKDSMLPLIKKDIMHLLEIISEISDG